jgi:hypothetical protein
MYGRTFSDRPQLTPETAGVPCYCEYWDVDGVLLVREGVSWVVGKVGDGIDWIGDRFSEGFDNTVELFEDAGDAIGDFFDW